MCIPRVPTRPKPVKRGQDRTGSRFSGSDREAVRSERRRQLRRQLAEAHIAVRERCRQEALNEELRSAQQAGRPIYSLGLWSSHTTGKRERPRYDGVILSSLDRERARKLASAAESCGTRYGAFRRYVVVEHGIQEQRLVAQQLCGTRACVRCDAEIRRHELHRVAGFWTQFSTLGFPPAGMTHRLAWYRLPRARALLFKRLEIAVERQHTERITVDAEASAACRALHDATPRKRRRESPLDYAWCIEPHESGFPHLHFVTTTSYIDFKWLRAIWSECIGRAVQWSKTIPVTSQNGVCWYLAKYISKCSLTLDLCAVMYRQRLWACTLPAPRKVDAGWLKEEETPEEEAALNCDDPSTFGERSIFKHVMGSAGRYQMWSRFWPVVSDAEAERFADETGWRWRPKPERPEAVEDDEQWRGNVWPMMDLLTEIVRACLCGSWSGSTLDRVHGKRIAAQIIEHNNLVLQTRRKDREQKQKTDKAAEMVELAL